uniref:RWD domain-containing protein 1-like n=1 Tax=Phallusia mammillata TaxID=59560 RepID=A0A6F9DQW0_9ASCI|nr:RWD domain-containing protein 1-like [Phallusia mammillata]
MTDYAEEQQNEIEALESIYPDSFNVISSDPHCFTVCVVSEEADAYGPQIESLSVTLKFTYTSKYPDAEPLFELADVDGLPDDSDVVEISDLISTQIEENLGMVMVFTIVSAVQEYLNDKKDSIITKIIEDKEMKEREEKEAEERKCHGTPVTVANFLAWKTKFDYEMMELEQKKAQSEKKSKKLTGREIFMQKHIKEDDSELLEGENVVEVDESLFEDLDDLDLECDEDLTS